MNREEIERLKEQEKAHLRKVRALKEQLREAQTKERLAQALESLDTSELDSEFEDSLRAVQRSNATGEARFEMAMDALDGAEERAKARADTEAFEEERRRAEAADLVASMKKDMQAGDETAATSSQMSPPDSAPDLPEETPAGSKTIGRPRRDRP